MKFSKHLIAAAILAAGLTQAALAQTYQASTAGQPAHQNCQFARFGKTSSAKHAKGGVRLCTRWCGE